MSSKTTMQAGPHAVAVVIDNALGRRLLLAAMPEGGRGYAEPFVIARTQEEAREVVRVLRDLLQDLPTGKATSNG